MSVRMRYVGVLCVAAALLLVALPAAGVPQMETVVDEGFESLDADVWGVTHSSASGTFGPALGKASVDDGVLKLAPTASRGGDIIWSRTPVVTSLPARVSMRLQFPGSGYRNARVYLAPASVMDDAGTIWRSPTKPYVQASLGTTSLGSYPSVYAYGESGGKSGQTLPSAVQLPTDEWLDVEVLLDDDGVTFVFDGRTMSAVFDMRSALDASGGFVLTFAQLNDINRRGVDIDRIAVEQASLAVNEPPVADAGPDAAAYVGEPVGFDGSASSDADGEIVSWIWDFGDGTTGVGAVQDHVYAIGGEYVAVLTVEDDQGACAIDEKVVRVLSPADGLAQLKASVQAANLKNKSGKSPRGYMMALLKKIDRAMVACASGDLSAMKAALREFLAQLNDAQVSKRLQQEWAAEVARIIAAAEYR